MTISALEEKLKVVNGITSQLQTAGTVNGTGIDTRDFDEALIVLNAGATSGSGTLDVKVQDSADNSSFTDISGAAFTQITTATDVANYVGRVRTKAYRRYIRIVSVNAVADAQVAVSVLLGKYDGLSPVTQTESFTV